MTPPESCTTPHRVWNRVRLCIASVGVVAEEPHPVAGDLGVQAPLTLRADERRAGTGFVYLGPVQLVPEVGEGGIETAVVGVQRSEGMNRSSPGDPAFSAACLARLQITGATVKQLELCPVSVGTGRA